MTSFWIISIMSTFAILASIENNMEVCCFVAKRWNNNEGRKIPDNLSLTSWSVSSIFWHVTVKISNKS